jgi:hypothetical protein
VSPILNFSASHSFKETSLILENSLKLRLLLPSFSSHFASFFKIQTTKASYQSVSLVLTATTLSSGTSSKVTGTKVLSFTILVISNLCANNQAIIFKDIYKLNYNTSFIITQFYLELLILYETFKLEVKSIKYLKKIN